MPVGHSVPDPEDAIEGIAHSLREARVVRDPAADASLANGKAGVACFFGYLFRACGREADRETALHLLDETIDAVAERQMMSGLFEGFTGIAWAHEHLCRLLGEEDDPNEEIDEAVHDLVRISPWSGPYDLIAGLVGLGLYAVERAPRPAALAILAEVVDRLDELAERDACGITWHTPPQHLPRWQRKVAPTGYHNLGVAHGTPGVVGLLALIRGVGVKTDAVDALLDGAVRWLLAQRLPADSTSCFGSWLAPGLPNPGARAAWCYGDPGIAAVLALAGHREDALHVVRKAARRDAEEGGIKDASLCHGTAGLGHIFRRLGQTLDDEEVLDASRRWTAATLAFRGSAGPGGFQAHYPDRTGRRASPWVDDPGLLSGAAGIGLALLAVIDPQAPAWDRLLLLSA